MKYILLILIFISCKHKEVNKQIQSGSSQRLTYSNGTSGTIFYEKDSFGDSIQIEDQHVPDGRENIYLRKRINGEWQEIWHIDSFINLGPILKKIDSLAEQKG